MKIPAKLKSIYRSLFEYSFSPRLHDNVVFPTFVHSLVYIACTIAVFELY